jgi:hypothetical protein
MALASPSPTLTGDPVRSSVPRCRRRLFSVEYPGRQTWTAEDMVRGMVSGVSNRGRSTLCLLASSALVAGLLTLPPAAHGRTAANLSLEVIFYVNGTITVNLPDGTPVGTTSGPPTIIPAGYYTLELSGPGGCAYLPFFELKGPGQEITEDLNGGEYDYTSRVINLLPNSTYTWFNSATPRVAHTFRTSGELVGTLPTNVPPSSGKPSSTVSNQDVVGSETVPFRGTLTGAVSAAGKLTLTYKGKSVTRLKAGRYKVAVTDKSSTNGFMLQKGKLAAVGVSGAAFVGTRSASVRLTPGRWFVSPRGGTKTYSIVVS